MLGDQKRKPPRVIPDYDCLPSILKDSRRFLGWRWVWERKKWDKPPFSAKDGMADRIGGYGSKAGF